MTVLRNVRVYTAATSGYHRGLMRKRSFILGIVFCLLASPLLCVAGVTEHPCECGDNVCCATPDAGDESCDVDPCGQMATVRAESGCDEPGAASTDVAARILNESLRAFEPIGRLPFARTLRLPTASITAPIRS